MPQFKSYPKASMTNSLATNHLKLGELLIQKKPNSLIKKFGIMSKSFPQSTKWHNNLPSHWIQTQKLALETWLPKKRIYQSNIASFFPFLIVSWIIILERKNWWAHILSESMPQITIQIFVCIAFIMFPFKVRFGNKLTLKTFCVTNSIEQRHPIGTCNKQYLYSYQPSNNKSVLHYLMSLP